MNRVSETRADPQPERMRRESGNENPDSGEEIRSGRRETRRRKQKEEVHRRGSE